MANATKCLTIDLAKGDSFTILFYNNDQYLKVYEKGTAADSTFKLNATGSDLTGVNPYTGATLKGAISHVVTGVDYIYGNTGSIYYKILFEVYEETTGGSNEFGVHGTKRKSGT